MFFLSVHGRLFFVFHPSLVFILFLFFLFYISYISVFFKMDSLALWSFRPAICLNSSFQIVVYGSFSSLTFMDSLTLVSCGFFNVGFVVSSACLAVP